MTNTEKITANGRKYPAKFNPVLAKICMSKGHCGIPCERCGIEINI